MTTDLTRIAAVTNALTGDVLEINKELVLSTAHMPPQLAEDMRHGFQQRFVFELLTDGFLVHVASTGYPEELAQAIALAQFNECKWIHFDADGPRLQSLPSWDY